MNKAPRQLKYKEIETALEEMISKASPGDRILSDRELAVEFDCNTLTVRKALASLVESGRIVRRTGSGSFVAGIRKVQQAKDVKKIAMLIHSECDSYGLHVVRSIHDAANKFGVTIRTAFVDGYGDNALRELALLADEGCSAGLVSWIPYREVSMLASLIRRSPLPLVIPVLLAGFEDNCFEKPEVSGCGDIQIAQACCEYFRMLGEKRIAFIGPDTHGDLAMKNKLSGYSEFMYRHDMDSIVGMIGSSVKEVNELAERWARYKGELAVVCYDDEHALRFVMAMHKLGLSAPKDFRIIGDNNGREALICDPPLTSGYGDYASYGEKAIRSVMAMGRGERWRAETSVVNMLCVRESCGGLERLTDEIVKALEVYGIKVHTASEYTEKTQK